MSNPLATIFYGDVTLLPGSDTSLFGYGDLNVIRKLIINGTENSTGATSVGSVLMSGGVRIAKNLHVHEDLNVLYGTTNLTVTHIDTTNGETSITGANAVKISVGGGSNFITTGGNLLLSAENNNSLQLYGGKAAINAVDIQASNSNGGISIMSGYNMGGIDIGSGSGGFTVNTSIGNVSITSNTGNTSIITNSGLTSIITNSVANNQDINLTLNGSTDSQISIQSSGTNVIKTALVINTTNTAGNISITNNDGLGSGSITQLSGSGGYTLRTNTGGNLNITVQGANSEFLLDNSANDQDMTISVNNAYDSSLILQSKGTVEPIIIQSTNNTGSITIQNTTGSSGGINIIAGSGGLIGSATGGSTIITTYAASSTYTNYTSSDYQDLNITVTGGTKSRVNITSDGTQNDAINLQTTNSGGIYMQSADIINIQSSANGINIGTINTVPINIGTSNSVTTVNGDLTVKGTTTTVDSITLTVEDNIILVNSGPTATADGGMAIKRYQKPNDLGNGDVVEGTPEVSGIAQTGSTTTITLANTASSNTDEYNGWWVKIMSGEGAGQVRRIQGYDGTTKVATIYGTGEEDGSNFSPPPDSTSTYGLYPCYFVMSIWDETANEFAFICSSQSPGQTVVRDHYADLHINDLTANNITANTINNTTADIMFNVTLNDDYNHVSLTGFPKNYGTYIVFVNPSNSSTKARAIFMIGRIHDPDPLAAGLYPGVVIRLISVKGTVNEQIDMQWPADSYPELYYRQKPNTGSPTLYDIKVISM